MCAKGVCPSRVSEQRKCLTWCSPSGVCPFTTWGEGGCPRDPSAPLGMTRVRAIKAKRAGGEDRIGSG
jgi:hypothetical protein